MKRAAFFLAAVFLLGGCGAPASSSQPAPEIQVVEVEPERFFATPYALEDVGYFLDIPEDIGIHDPNGEGWKQFTEPPYEVMTLETSVFPYSSTGEKYSTNAEGGLSLYGRMTAVRLRLEYSDINSSKVSPVLLQAYLNEELETLGARIPFLQPYARGNLSLRRIYGRDPEDLEDYVVYRDETITVYDLFLLTENPRLEEQLQAAAEFDGLPERGIDHLWLLEVDTYLRDVTQGGVGRFIKPIPEGTE